MRTNKMNTRALVEGALLAGLTAVLALIGIYIPILRPLTNLIWAIPIVIAIVHHGPLTGLLSIGVAGMLIFVMSSPVEAVFLVLQFGGLALVYGYAFYKGLRPGWTLLAGTGTAVASILLVLFLSFLLFDVKPAEIIEEMRQTVEPTIEIYRNMGVFEKYQDAGFSEETMRQMLTGFIEMIRLVVPAILIVYGIMSAFLNYLIAQKVLGKLNIKVPALPPFRLWRLPWWTVWGFIAGLGANMLGSYWEIPLLSVIGANIMLVYGPVLLVLGFSVVSFFMHKYLEGALAYRLLFLVIFLFFLQPMMVALACIGLADLLFNYRKLRELK